VEKLLIERRIRWASVMIGAGLVLQFFTLLRVHPLAFVVFLAIGCPLVAAGVILYLWSLVSPRVGRDEIDALHTTARSAVAQD
jgi:hypothetical protein